MATRGVNKLPPNFPRPDGNNLIELKINEGGFMGWFTFGGSYWADNLLHGKKSLARYMTGGSPHNHGPVGGSSVDNDYATALPARQGLRAGREYHRLLLRHGAERGP